MSEFDMIWRVCVSLGRSHAATSPVGRALVKWARDNRKDLKLPAHSKAKPFTWRALITTAQKRAKADASASAAMRLAQMLRLDDADSALLDAIVCTNRGDLMRGLAEALAALKVDHLTLFGGIAGLRPLEARDRVTKGDLDRLGLVELSISKDGTTLVWPSWTFNKLLDKAAGDEDMLVEMLIGRRQRALLPLDSFARLAAEVDFMVRLVSGALANGEPGINILLYGPPGTGKTELARTMAEAAGGALFSVAEADDSGEEPLRWERVTAYRLAQRVAERRRGTVLLFDEMEDLIGGAERRDDDTIRNRSGSKIYINRLLETNAAPTIWTTNAVNQIDPAILRRMSFVIKLDYPSPESARAMLARVGADERVVLDDGGLARLSAHAPEAATVFRNALRAGRLSGGGEADSARAATALVASLRGEARLRPAEKDASAIDLGLYEADRDIAGLLTRLSSDATPDDFSLLLTGPPGTGKTALAHHLAYRLDRPLIVKRTSDLLSKWVGETEENIAAAFDEAVNRGGVLLFDEVDSLLFDRSTAQRSWEVTQVNELLTWFDSHPLPFVAATNHGHKLDPAAMRRFVFKLDLKPLAGAKAEAAYRRFFGAEPPAELSRMQGLTPGDLAVVARQMRYRDGAVDVMAMLAAELAAKPEGGGRIGF